MAMQKLIDFVQDEAGNAMPGSSVLVRTYPGNVTASLFSDNAGATAIDNPITAAETDGKFEFYAADGHYSLIISGPGITTKTLLDAVTLDANDPSFGGQQTVFEDGDGITIINQIDATKQAQFDASQIAPATTRTYAFPDANGTFVLEGAPQEISNKTLINPLLTDTPQALYYIEAPGGTADAMTGTIAALSVMIEAAIIGLRAIGANTVTAPTLNVNGFGVVTITRAGNQPLIAGDIPRANYEVLLRYNADTARFELLNPAPRPVVFGFYNRGAQVGTDDVFRFTIPWAVTLPQNLTGTTVSAHTAATANTDITLKKTTAAGVTTSIGTLRYNAAGGSTLTFAADVSFAAGDAFHGTPPAADLTLAGFGASFHTKRI